MEKLFLGKLCFALLLRKTGLGNLDAARQYLVKAMQVAPSLVERQEELSRLIAFWAMEQPPDSRLTLVQRVLDSLPGDSAGSSQLWHRVLGKMHVSQAFSEYAKGHAGQVWRHILRGLRHDPSHLKNRGVIAIFARSFLNKRIPDLRSTNDDGDLGESAPPQSVASRVEEVLGCAIDSARCLKGLSGSKIYLIKANEWSYVLRLLGRDVLEQAVAVVKRVRAVGVPTPDIVAFASLSAADDEPVWLLEEWSSGSWFIPPNMSLADELIVITDLGRHLRDLHRINTKGFGSISSAQLDAPYPTFEAWLDHRQQTIEEGCSLGAIPESALSALVAADRLLRETFAGPPVLCHADLGRGNILVDAGRVKAIIDWGDAVGGDPAYDIALLFSSMSIYWRPQKIGALLPAFLRAYGADGSEGFYRRVIAHRLLYAAHEAAWLVCEDKDGNEYFDAYQSILADAGLVH